MIPIKKEKITPLPLKGGISLNNLVDNYFTAYNSARMREICHLLKEKIFRNGVTIGLSLSGALAPAGFGSSIISPLIKNGFIDYIVTTGANLYHDIHFGIGLDLYMSTPFLDDIELRKDKLIRIYDIVFDLEVLLKTDNYLYKLLESSEFQRKMGTPELHYLIGKYICETQKKLGIENDCFLTAAYKADIPIYTPSPGDSSIGLNIAAKSFLGVELEIDIIRDVNEITAIVYDAKKNNGKSAVIIIGGGSPKNFILQTEPQLQEILGIEEKGHDYFIQITDARPDTGGLSGATPGEAISWGKIDSDAISNSIVCYCDSTIALPLIAAYALTSCESREMKRLYRQRDTLLNRLKEIYLAKKGRLKGENF